MVIGYRGRVTPPASALPIDIIVPVYRGLAETRACLESVFGAARACASPHEIVVVDDRSPEPELSAWLRELEARGRITLLIQPQNQGFVASVNRGMGLHPDRDVILLNSDTEVAGDWVDRLAQTASGPNVATVTPFSNNATICSYPRFCQPNELPRGESLGALDAVFREANRGQSMELPTGVGFCMYIRRAALDRLGLFDVQSFGKGYGEENDFCRRAVKAKLRNLLAADVFVLHRGGVSFGATQTERMRAGAEKLRQLHPEYAGAVDRFCRADPARPLRHAASVARLRASARPRLLFITHRNGGGVEKHVRELAAFAEASAEVLILRPHGAGNLAFSLEWARMGEDLTLYFLTAEALLGVLQGLGISRVHVHHTLKLALAPAELAKRLGVPYDFTAHDFLTLTPTIHGEPEATASGAKWREAQRPLVEGAERVLAPSRDTARRLLRYFPAARVRLAPHLDAEFPAVRTRPPGAGALRVALLGLVDEKKGAIIARDVARLARKQSLPLEFHVIGKLRAEGDGQPAAWIDHGPYADDAELDRKLAQAQPHLAWFPGQIPETYSYVLSAAFRAALPAMASDLGAIAERLAGRPWSWVVPAKARPADWLRELQAAREALIAQRAPQPTPPAPEDLPTFDYPRDYLAGITVRAGSPIPLGAAELKAFASDPMASGGKPWVRALLALQHSGPAQRLIGALSPAQRERIKRWVYRVRLGRKT